MFKTILSITIFLLSLACETPKAKKEPITYKSEDVLYKLGDRSPIISQIDEEKWLQIAASDSSTIDTVYANIATGEPQAAEKLARAFLTEYPRNVDGLEALAHALAASKKSDLASYYASYVLELDENRYNMHNILGLSQASRASTMTDFKKAKSHFARAFYKPDGSVKSIAAGLNLGYLELETGAILRAKKIFSQVANVCGDCGPAMLGIGITERRSGNTKKSIEPLRVAQSNASTHFIASYHLALSYKSLNEHRKAKDLLNEIIDEAPSNEDVLISRSSSLSQQIQIEIDDNNNSNE
jgi:tetratricopeptide (TPR) repeat protein